MALFTPKKKKAQSPNAGEKNVVKRSAGASRAPRTLLSRPRITEKASFLMESKVYTFEIAPRANKQEVKKAVKDLYNVEAVKVRVVNLPRKFLSRNTRSGVRTGTGPAVKKAYVHLRKGDSISVL